MGGLGSENVYENVENSRNFPIIVLLYKRSINGKEIRRSRFSLFCYHFFIDGQNKACEIRLCLLEKKIRKGCKWVKKRERKGESVQFNSVY